MSMTGTDVVAWRQRHGWDQRQAATRLGINRRTIQRWEVSTKPHPEYVALACAQIDAIESRKPPEVVGDAHKQLDWIGDLDGQPGRVAKCLAMYGPQSRTRIAEITTIPIKSVDRCVHGLMKRGTVVNADVEPDTNRMRVKLRERG